MPLDTTISLTTVNDVLTWLDEAPERDGMWIYYTGSSETATVEVQDNALVLVDSTTKTIDLTAEAYDTLTELVAYINASVSDWSAGLLFHPSASSADLVITGAVSALGVANKQTLRIRADYLIEQLINRASDFLNRYTNRILKSTAYTNARYDGTGGKLLVDAYPITAIDQICTDTLGVIKAKYTSTTARNAYLKVSSTGVNTVVDGTADTEQTFADYATITTMATALNALSGWSVEVVNSDYDAYPSSQLFAAMNISALNSYAYLDIPGSPLTDYIADLDTGIIYITSGFSSGFQNVYISFTGGYSTIPASLEEACIRLVKMAYDRSERDESLKSEKMGAVYQYTLRDLQDGLPSDLLAQVDLFKSRSF